MIVEFTYAEDLQTVYVVAEGTYKTLPGIVNRMIDECDKKFGADNWDHIPDTSLELSNPLGWYARIRNGHATIQAIAKV